METLLEEAAGRGDLHGSAYAYWALPENLDISLGKNITSLQIQTGFQSPLPIRSPGTYWERLVEGGVVHFCLVPCLLFIPFFPRGECLQNYPKKAYSGY